MFLVQRPSLTVNTVQEELRKFLLAADAPIDTDPIKWWGNNEQEYPKLGHLAKTLFAVQPTSSSSERVFSTCGNVYTEKRMSLLPKNASQIIFLHENHAILKLE
jgi:hypothetical protein